MKKLTIKIALCMLTSIVSVDQGYALDDDRFKVEALLVKINNAVSSQDYETFQSALIVGGHDSRLSYDEWLSWVSDSKKGKVLLHKYPLPKGKAKFIKVKRQREQLIYFCEIDLNNKNVQTVKAISFQKQKGEWKHYGRARSVSRARAKSESARRGIPTWQDSGGISHAIDADSKFQFDHMFRPFKK